MAELVPVAEPAASVPGCCLSTVGGVAQASAKYVSALLTMSKNSLVFTVAPLGNSFLGER